MHRGLADETCRQHEGMNTELFQLFGNDDTVVAVHATLEAVEHVGLDHHGHVVAGDTHHLFDDEFHETHPVVKDATKLIVTVVGVGRQELTDEVAVSRMNLHAVESCLAGQVNSLAEVKDQGINLLLLELSDESRRIHVEATGGAHGHTTAGGAVRHVATVSKLDGGLGSIAVDGIGESLQVGNNLLTHPELAVERESRLVDGGVCHRCHADSAFGHSGMIGEQFIGGTVTVGHVFKGRRSYHPITQCDRPNLTGSEYR